MHVPTGAIIPVFIVSFIVLAYQYFRINPDRRVWNLHFGMMFGALLLMIATNVLSETWLSPLFFVLALFWLGTSIYLFRQMPPRQR